METWLYALRAAFEANLAVNCAVLAVLSIGVCIAMVQAAAMRPVRHWVDQTSRGFSVKEPPALVAPLARVLSGKERDGFVLSLAAMGALLAGVRRRLNEARHVSSQVLAALVFLTLIGAFWSAAQLGLAAIVILGLANLWTRHAQDRAVRQVEDFLAQRAELPSSLLGGESALPAYLEALLRQTAENLSEIQRMMIRGEEERRATQAALASLTETLSAVSDQLRAQQKVVLALSKNHYDVQPAIADLATQVAGAVAGSEEMRDHLRNLDLAVARLVDEVSAARAQTPEAMRREIKVLAQTLAHARNGDRPHFSAAPREPQ
ncbi:MAG TPA: hypothetical protein VFZ81_00370 [Burkholderiales bacterium]